MILSPNRKHDGDAAIHADDDEEEDAAEHVEEHDEGSELAHEEAEDPVRCDAVGDVKRQTGAEYEVGYSQTQVPGSIDWSLHAKPCNPDNHTISSQAQQTDDHVDPQQQHAKNLSETCGGGDVERNFFRS